MALSTATLESELTSALDAYASSESDAADLLAAAYQTYADAATFGVTVPAYTGAEQTGLAAALLAGMTGAFPAFAGAWASGLTAFWTGVPVAGGGQTGVTVPPPGASAIQSALVAALGATPYVTSTAAAAQAIAGVLATATATTTATVAPPPGTILPIT